MAKNTGKPSEELFEDHFTRFGKAAYVYRFVDAAEVRGRTGRIGMIRPAPSDFFVVHNGNSFFAEVKSTQNPTSFPFSLLRRTQSAHAKMVMSAGASYFVFLHDLTRNLWFKIPYSFIEGWTKSKSIPWQHLSEFTYDLS